MSKIYGHRGARGLYPENTMEGFEKTLKMPVAGIELDIVVSKDGKLVASHEPWMNHLFCTDQFAQPITIKEERNFNIYQLNYDEIKRFDCGQKANPRFPYQRLAPAIKPLLRDVFQLLNEKGSESLIILLEPKSEQEEYGKFQPYPEQYAELVVHFLNENPLNCKLVIQSFDPLLLNAIYRIKAMLNMGLLVENDLGIDENLSKLDFKPAYYNLYHALVSEEVFSHLRTLGIAIIPWTVNSKKEKERLDEIGISDIITDYPDLFL